MVKPTENPGTQGAREVWVSGGVLLADQSGDRIDFESHNFGIEDRYALPVTGPEIKALVDLIGELLQEQRKTNLYMSRLTGEELTIDDLEGD